MRVRTTFAAHHLLLAAIVIGLAGFVAVHSALLFSADHEIHVLVRRAWLAGLGFVVALCVYLFVTEQRPTEE